MKRNQTKVCECRKEKEGREMKKEEVEKYVSFPEVKKILSLTILVQDDYIEKIKELKIPN